MRQIKFRGVDAGMGECIDEYEGSAPIKDCKLILKPLSAITEEDKREYEKAFPVSTAVTGFEMSNNTDGVYCFGAEYECSLLEILWLASHGYDVGIAPDEYKIVEVSG